MPDKEKVLEFVRRFVTLNETEQTLFLDSFKETKIKKRQFIVQPNYTARHRNYVLSGAFRGYVVGDEGREHTILFAIDDWWITDYNSYIFQQPATMFVVALEDSTILQLDFEQEQQLKKASHVFETLFRIMAERGLAFYQRRLISNLTQTAEERYEEFLTKYGAIVQRVPQYALASYLGMTTEFLSRIRNKKTKKS